MFDVKIINNEAILFENDIEVMNLEHLRDEDGDIRYTFTDGSYIRIWGDNTILWFDFDDNYHRNDGPAVIWPNGSVGYYLDYIEYTKEKFDIEVAQRALVKSSIDLLNTMPYDNYRRAWNVIRNRFNLD